MNAIIDDKDPEEKEIFLLPMEFLNIKEFLEKSNCFVDRLFNTFNSYPALKYVVAPYKEFILKISVRHKSLQCFWFSPEEIPQNFFSFVDEAISLSLRYNRYHYHLKFTDGLKPTTHSKNLFGKDDTFYSQWNHDNRNLKYDVRYLRGNVRKRWEIDKVVLLHVPCFCDVSDKMDIENHSHFFNLEEEEQESVLKRFDSAMFGFALSGAEVLMAHRVIENKLHMTDADGISSAIILGEGCMINSHRCNAVPEKIPNFFTEELYDQFLDEKRLVDYEFVTIALRAIYHYYGDKDDTTFAPLYINTDGLNACNNEFVNGKRRGQDTPRLVLHDDFVIQDNITLVFFLPTHRMLHTVCGKMVFTKNKTNDNFKTEVTVYDSVLNPVVHGFDKKSDIKHIKDSRYALDDLESEDNPTSELSWLKHLTDSHIKHSVVQRLECFQSFNQFKRTDVRKMPSILVQYKKEDNTCAINSFLCALLLMLGKNPEDGIPGVLEDFKSIKEYRHSMVSLMYLIVSKYLEDSGSVIDYFDKDTIKLSDDKYYKNIKAKCEKNVSGRNYVTALGEDIVGLFDFLGLEMSRTANSKYGMCKLCWIFFIEGFIISYESFHLFYLR